MSKNGKLSLTPKAKEAAERFSAKAFAKALRLDKFGPQIETQIADLCHEAWAAGYFYAKQEKSIKTIETMEEEYVSFAVKIPKADNDKIMQLALNEGWTHYKAVNYLIHKAVEQQSIFKDPRIEVPDTDRQVIIMVTIYDWFVAKWDANENLWKCCGRSEGYNFSRGYVHRWMEMQDDFKVKQ